MSASDISVFFNDVFREQQSIVNKYVDTEISKNEIEQPEAEVIESFFDKRLTLAAQRRIELEKQVWFREIDAENAVLKTRLLTFKTDAIRDFMILNLVMNVDVINDAMNTEIYQNVAYRRRSIKSKEIPLYHRKNTKKHIDYKQNCFITFRLISEDYLTKNLKIVYTMQCLIENCKNFWFNFEKTHPNHEYSFQQYFNFLLNLIDDSINCQLNYIQTFNETKQRNDQNVREFDVYLTNLKAHLILYTEKQQMTHFFTKLRRKIRDAVTNYQTIPKIKTELLMVAARIKNNLKRIQKYTQSDKEIKSFNRKRKTDDVDKDDDKFSRRRRGNRGSKSFKRDLKKNHSKLICYICDKKNHIFFNCSNKDKKKTPINAIKDKPKKEKTSRTFRQSKETKTKKNNF